MEKQNFALIDMGSNSIRLVIYLIHSNGYYKEIHNMKIVARLSSHIEASGNLSNKGLDILIEALQNIQEVTRAHQVTNVQGVATAAIRQAKNQQDILDRISSETDFEFNVFSEYEEAYHGYLAIVNSTNIKDGISIDIGGGSTEITVFQNRELLHYHSFPFGAITLKQRFLENEIPTDEEITLLKNYIQDQFQTLPWLEKYKFPVIGIGGSARNISLIHQRSINYPLGGLHQYEILPQDIHQIKELLQRKSLQERQQVEGLSKDRADIIIPAVEVISSLIDIVNAPKFILSNKGLRDGIFYQELFNRIGIEQFPNVAEESFHQFTHEYEINIEHIKQVAKLVTKLFYELQGLKMLNLNGVDLQLLRQASRILYVGEYISREASSQHTFYLLTNQSIDGLTHTERLSIALIASFKSKSVLNDYITPYKNLLTKTQIKKIELLGAMLKFVYSLNRTRRNVISNVSVFLNSDMTLSFNLYYNNNAYFEEQLAAKYKKHLEKVLNLKIHLNLHELPSI
ncbi:exopolyphosphatase [Anaerobacillus sp. MEB173]|uniref:Ppx/GppA phosphatase family protein n=1 Tax=Anaerobacillus sp. MEB173 TaxID=3383345 RepID=UPI003F912ED9